MKTELTEKRIATLLNISGKWTSKTSLAVFSLAGCVAYADQALTQGVTPTMLALAGGLFANLLSGKFLDILDKGANVTRDDEEEIFRIWQELDDKLAIDDKLQAQTIEITDALRVYTLAVGTALERQNFELSAKIFRATESASEKTQKEVLAVILPYLDKILHYLESDTRLIPNPVKEPQIEVAKNDEILVVVGKFVGTKGEDISLILVDQIRLELLKSRLSVRIEAFPDAIDTDSNAYSVMSTYGASCVIWGIASEYGLRVKRFLQIGTNIGNVYLFGLDVLDPKKEEFFIEVNENLPSFLSALALVSAGSIFSSQGNSKAAIRAFSTVITEYLQYNQLKAYCFNSRGVLHWQNGKSTEAIEDFTATIKFNPDDAMAYANRGVNFVITKRFKEAQKDYAEAERLAIEQNDLAALVHANYIKANLESFFGRFQTAYDFHRKSIDVGIFVSSAQFNNMGKVCLELKRDEESISYFSEAINRNWTWSDIGIETSFCNRGVAYYRLGLYDKAIQDYSEAIHRKHDFFPAYLNRGQTYKSLWIDNNPKNFYSVTDDVPDTLLLAIQDFQTAYKIDRNSPDALYLLGVSQLFLQSERETGIKNLHRLLHLAPKHKNAIEAKRILEQLDT